VSEVALLRTAESDPPRCPDLVLPSAHEAAVGEDTLRKAVELVNVCERLAPQGKFLRCHRVEAHPSKWESAR
jgi:hypothetical protein